MSGVWKTNTMVLSAYMRNAMLLALKTGPAAALWPTPKIHLSQDPAFNPGPNDTNATLAVHEATFTGYTAQTPTFVVPVNLDTQTQGLVCTVVFEATGSTVTNNIYGYWGDDGTNLFGAESRTTDPIAVAVANDFVQVDFQMPIGAFQNNPALT